MACYLSPESSDIRFFSSIRFLFHHSEIRPSSLSFFSLPLSNLYPIKYIDTTDDNSMKIQGNTSSRFPYLIKRKSRSTTEIIAMKRHITYIATITFLTLFIILLPPYPNQARGVVPCRPDSTNWLHRIGCVRDHVHGRCSQDLPSLAVAARSGDLLPPLYTTD